MPQNHLEQRQSHVPVMVQEVLSFLVNDPNGTYVDCTLGCGGHAAAILETLSHRGRLIGLDKDKHSFLVAGERLKTFGERALLFNKDFRQLPEVLKETSTSSVSGILFDLGLSSFQLGDGRGFSYQEESPLDMRYDQNSETTAADIVNTLSGDELARLFESYSDMRNSRNLARVIVDSRRNQPMVSTTHLVSALRRVSSRRHPHSSLARIFQALRIAVNDELEAIREALAINSSFLAPRGVLCTIAYHSGEDRIVKHFLRELVDFADGGRGKLELLAAKPLRPTREEVLRNPRSSSARLRAARRLENVQVS